MVPVALAYPYPCALHLAHVTFTWPVNLGLVGLSLILAAVTYYALELPIRKLKFYRTVWAAAGAGLMSVAVATGTSSIRT